MCLPYSTLVGLLNTPCVNASSHTSQLYFSHVLSLPTADCATRKPYKWQFDQKPYGNLTESLMAIWPDPLPCESLAHETMFADQRLHAIVSQICPTMSQHSSRCTRTKKLVIDIPCEFNRLDRSATTTNWYPQIVYHHVPLPTWRCPRTLSAWHQHPTHVATMQQV